MKCETCYFADDSICHCVVGSNFGWATEVSATYVCPNYLWFAWGRLVFWFMKKTGVPMFLVDKGEKFNYYQDANEKYWLAKNRWGIGGRKPTKRPNE
jgi:hypothetical protein